VKNVLSFVLYGNTRRYIVGAFINAILAKKIYPDFVMRIYIAHKVPAWTVEELKKFSNVEILIAPAGNEWFANAWRFLAFSDREVDVVLIRDIDARLTVRERRAYEEWLDSGLDFHVMKDHKIGHKGWPMSAGMWGGYADKLRNMATMMGMFMQEETNRGPYLSDQKFLSQRVWVRVEKSCMIHDSFFDTKVTAPSVTKKFPIELENPANHVGAALDENDYYIFWVDESLSVKNGGIGKFEYDLELLEAY
jgi:hypothetical protein